MVKCARRFCIYTTNLTNLSTTKINILKLINRLIHSLCITTMHLCCLALLLACCVCGAYHRALTHYTRHKTSDIIKEYIYIDIIYHINYKCAYIKRESLTGQYHATSHQTILQNAFNILLIQLSIHCKKISQIEREIITHATKQATIQI